MALIVLAGVAAYANSFQGPFIFDDLGSIRDNATIRRLWPPWNALVPPRISSTSGGRPLLNLSFAVNYALDELNVRGYHAANLAIHLMAALTLFGILRRTFQSPKLQDRFGSSALGLALAISLLWMLHPLQTESVTYVVQRAESLMGLFYLLTLYCTIRGSQSPWPVGWYALAILACLAGMATKEVMVTAPLVVLLYDRQFLAGSFQAALRRRWGLYLGLAATWALLAYLVFSTGLMHETPDPGQATWRSYAWTQPEVVLHYLRLSFWPHPLCLDYDWPAATSWTQALPSVVLVGGLVAMTIWALVRRSPWGFAGAWFFLILAPTSSVLPLRDLAFEHRMYLPLVAVVAGCVASGLLLGQWLARRGGLAAGSTRALGVCAVIVVGATFGARTCQRNLAYRSELLIWSDTAAKAPDNARAHGNLGNALFEKGDLDEAIHHLRWALKLDPQSPRIHNSLASALGRQGRVDEAIEHYREALRIKPDYAEACNNMGVFLLQRGRAQEAEAYYKKALEADPSYTDAHYNLAALLYRQGKIDKAIEHYQAILAIDPKYADAHFALGGLSYQRDDLTDAIAHWRAGLRVQPDHVLTLNLAAWLLATHPDPALRSGREAIEYAQRACALLGNRDAAAVDTLAAAYAEAGEFSKAVQTAQRAKELAAAHADRALTGKIEARIRLYQSNTPYREPTPGAAVEPHSP